MPLAAVIYNPIAGGSRGEHVSALAEARLRDLGYEVERLATRDRSGAVPVAGSVAGRVDRVVAVGGDGTLREVVEGLGEERARTVLGIVPMGNANIVARELGIPKPVSEAIEIAAAGTETSVDLGTLSLDGRESLFLGVVGIGWDADTVHRLDRIRHSLVGRHAYRLWADGLYGVSGLAAAFRLRQPRFTVDADGVALPDRYCAAFFCNLATYGKGMVVTPGADRSSGLIHAQARRSAFAPALALQLGAAVAGRRAPPWLSDYAHGHSFVSRAERPVRIQVDGDARGEAHEVQVGVMPGALRIAAPSAPR